MRRSLIVLGLAVSLSVPAAAQCPTTPPPACPARAAAQPAADVLLAEVVEASNRLGREYERERREHEEAGASRRASRRGRRARPPDEPLRPRPLGDAARAFVGAGTRFVCTFPSHSDAITVRYRIARVYYEANAFADAAELFRAIAMDHPSHELAEYAAQLYLDSLHVLATRAPEPRAACTAALRAAVEPLSSLFCATASVAQQHADLCSVLSRLRCDGLALEADRLSREGSHGEAAEAYARIAREHSSCGRGDVRLFEAAREYDAARLVEAAIAARWALVEQFPESSLAQRARLLMGRSLHALARYREAAEQYVELARRYPLASRAECTPEEGGGGACADPRELLGDAIHLYVGLGERAAAERAIRLYERLYGRDRERAAELAFLEPRMQTEAEAWPEARSGWQRWLRRYGPAARADQLVEAIVALGRAHAALGEHERAQEQYAEVQRRWDGGALLRRVAAPSESERATREHAVRRGVAEALFRRTDRRARALRASRRPSAEALDALELELSALPELEVAAWSIAAAARLAELELHAAEGSRGDARRHLTARAIEHAEHCARTAIAIRWPSDEARACMALLSRLAPDRFPPPDEIIPSLAAPAPRGVEAGPVGASDGAR